MRKEVYQILKKRLQRLITDGEKNVYLVTEDQLQEMTGRGEKPDYAIKHVGLWNRQVEFIEDETPFLMPAIFIEFGQISWRGQAGGSQDGDLSICFHVITNAIPEGYDGDTFHLDLLDRLNACLHGFNHGGMGTFTRVTSIPCHDHEEILDNTEIFKCLIRDDTAVREQVRLPARPDISVD